MVYNYHIYFPFAGSQNEQTQLRGQKQKKTETKLPDHGHT